MLATISSTAEKLGNLPPRFHCRVHERQPCELPTSCRPAAAFGVAENNWTGIIRDISPGGLQLTLGRRFEPGTGLAIELGKGAAAKVSTVFVKVVHVKRQENGLWALGCKFISELGEDEIGRLVPAVDEQPPKKKVVSAVHFQIDLSSVSAIHYIVNQLNVPESWPLPPGTDVTVRGGRAVGSPWELTVEVVLCQQHEEGWVFQGRLHDAPSATALLHFLGHRTVDS